VPTAAARRLRIAQAQLWITPLLWSSNYVVARLCHGVIAPHVLALGRWTLALAIMLPIAWRGLVRNGAPWRAEWRQLLVLGGLGMWVCGAFVYIGGKTTTAINFGRFYAAAPVLIAAISARLLGESMTRGQIAGLLLALLGVVFVIAKGQIGPEARSPVGRTGRRAWSTPPRWPQTDSEALRRSLDCTIAQ
jgi:drug/metabolite transporter (DMT)-like permease